MDDKELDALEAICDAATPDEWRAGRMDMVSYAGTGDGGPYKNVYVDDARGGIDSVTGEQLPYTVARGEGNEDECRANAAFIAAARTAVPKLIAEVRFLQEIHRTHLDTLVRIADALGMNKDDFTLVDEFAGRLRADNERMRGIVRDVAAIENPSDHNADCMFCGWDMYDCKGTIGHIETCPWRRAREEG